MSDDYRPEGFEDSDNPLPRDMPDQQAGAEETRKGEEEADRRAGTGADAGKPGGTGETGGTGEDVPEADEAGTGRRGSPEASGPGTPAPEESPG
ncbi:hypothetical protein [Streptomyces peucetius]|uniref:Uncharacterized protein n=1 Tax=Streptomyces peucetius TaxID=1950 RepID=A0ABY6IH25_STRPE|nr:hypothetical protein [Streptomyces peucetius]UYQ66039.1 hypothetical protein OGH68_34335 [Streptomyces peucetius]